MTVQQRILALSKWGSALHALIDDLPENPENPLFQAIVQAQNKNAWFAKSNSINALKEICNILKLNSLNKLSEVYIELESSAINPKIIGIVMAGNIPLVGFHDLLCVLITGHNARVRLSSDDSVLIPAITNILFDMYPEFGKQVEFVNQLSGMDAVIATGSNNTARYFDYYFGKYPSLIRKNRNSVAVLNGQEPTEDLTRLGHDIFDYFGLGCRNVSKLYVPSGYQFDQFFGAMEPFASLMEHNKYMNNYDYHRALFLLDGIPFLTNNYLIVRENEAYATPVSVINYEYYNDLSELESKLAAEKDLIQCRVGVNGLPLGAAQQPNILDFADGVDTIQWLLSL
ncbi:MAG: acyl-CoA reductase [Bacteroidota bacterium]